MAQVSLLYMITLWYYFYRRIDCVMRFIGSQQNWRQILSISHFVIQGRCNVGNLNIYDLIVAFCEFHTFMRSYFVVFIMCTSIQFILMHRMEYLLLYVNCMFCNFCWWYYLRRHVHAEVPTSTFVKNILFFNILWIISPFYALIWIVYCCIL